MVDQDALFKALRTFAHTLADSYDVTDALYELSDSVVEVLQASAAGVALRDGDDLRFVTATSEEAVAAERVQERLGAGPCHAALEEGLPVPVADLRERHGDWPELCREVEQLGFRAVLGLPLALGERRVGSIDVYDRRPRQWSETAIAAGVVLADMAAGYILNASELARRQRTTEQLQQALDSRVVVEQAKGKVCGQLGVSTAEAFERIRRHARSNNITVQEASRLVLEHDARVLHG